MTTTHHVLRSKPIEIGNSKRRRNHIRQIDWLIEFERSVAKSEWEMARWSLLLLTVVLGVAAAAGSSSFEDSNPIRLVSDLEEQVLQVIGQTRHAVSFARFARRYGKRYDSVEEIQHRFRIFSENLQLIKSTNKKRLSYKLGLNRTCSSSFWLCLFGCFVFDFDVIWSMLNHRFRGFELGWVQNSETRCCSKLLCHSQRQSQAYWCCSSCRGNSMEQMNFRILLSKIKIFAY